MIDSIIKQDINNCTAKHCYSGMFEHLEPTEQGKNICDYASKCIFQKKDENGVTLCKFEQAFSNYLDKKYSNVKVVPNGVVFTNDEGTYNWK